MFNELKAYSVTEKAGLPWLDSIPSHWHLARVKEILQPIDVRSVSGAEELLTVSSYRGVVPRSGEKVTMFQAATYAGHKLCWPGDLVINSLWAWGGGLGVSPLHGIVSTAYGVYRSRSTQQLDPAYLHSLVRSEPFNWELQYRSRGVWKSRLQLTDDRFLAAPIPLPPLGEQAAIVKYLGHAHARIDRAVAAKRKLIALLEEQKQAIIHQAVTRGLDPSVPLKDSGIPWLGEIPAHWKVTLLGRLLAGIEQGWSPVAAEGDLEDDQWAVLTLAAIDRGRFCDSAHKPIARSAKIPMRLELRDGDLLLTRSNTRSRVGDVAIVRNPRKRTIFSDLIYRLRFAEQRIAPEFAALVLRSRIGRIQIERDARGSSNTMPKISHALIRGWRIPLPPLQDQVTIVRGVDAQLLGSSSAIGTVTQEIELLREFLTRLTSDVVTGQVDVGEIAATLPELTDDVLDSADDELIESELELAGADE